MKFSEEFSHDTAYCLNKNKAPLTDLIGRHFSGFSGSCYPFDLMLCRNFFILLSALWSGCPLGQEFLIFCFAVRSCVVTVGQMMVCSTTRNTLFLFVDCSLHVTNSLRVAFSHHSFQIFHEVLKVDECIYFAMFMMNSW